MFWQQRDATSTTNQRIEVKTTELRQLNRELDTKKQEIDGLEAGIRALKEERDTREKAHKEIAAGSTNWYGAFADLFDSDPRGIEFGSVSTVPGGQVVLGGIATEAESMVSLPILMISISDALDFQGIVWEPGTDPPSFIATFQVRE